MPTSVSSLSLEQADVLGQGQDEALMKNGYVELLRAEGGLRLITISPRIVVVILLATAYLSHHPRRILFLFLIQLCRTRGQRWRWEGLA